jgi:hypothetical protein
MGVEHSDGNGVPNEKQGDGKKQKTALLFFNSNFHPNTSKCRGVQRDRRWRAGEPNCKGKPREIAALCYGNRVLPCGPRVATAMW